MDDYQKLFNDISNQNIKAAELECRKKDRYQNRFNYYNSVVATLALILSIIGIILSKKSGIGKSTINNIENGKVSPTLFQLEMIAIALGVKITDLFESEYK